MSWVKATPTTTKLKLLLTGPSGSGKTTSALRIATGIARVEGSSIGLVDTQLGQSHDEGRFFDFETRVLTKDWFSPTGIRHTLREAHERGYGVLVIDSMSPVWESILTRRDAAGEKDKWRIWGELQPQWREMMAEVMKLPAHVIVTAKEKVKHEQVKRDGRTVIESLGLDPILKPGDEYEYPVWLGVDQDHVCAHRKAPKRLFEAVGEREWNPVTEATAEELLACIQGRPVPQPQVTEPPPELAEEDPEERLVHPDGEPPPWDGRLTDEEARARYGPGADG